MAIEPARKHAFGYVRMSTDKQKDSPEIQKEQIERYFKYLLESQNFTWVRHYEDKATSAKKALRNREEGFRLDIELEKGDAVVFTKLDRAFRRVADCAMVVEAWHARGIQLHILDLNIDTSTPMGRAMIGMAAVFAELERSRISERQKESQAYRKSLGRHTAGLPPYGFKATGHKGNRKLVPDPASRRIGKHVVHARLLGRTYEEIYWGLFKDGERRANGKEWALSTLRKMFLAECKLMQMEERERKQNGQADKPPNSD